MPRDDDDFAQDPPSSINPYEVLGVEEKATADAIKSAYRKKALRYHPGNDLLTLSSAFVRVDVGWR